MEFTLGLGGREFRWRIFWRWTYQKEDGWTWRTSFLEAAFEDVKAVR